MRSLSFVTAILLAATPESAPPVDVGVTEETGTTLGQVDVTLSGPPEALARVGAQSLRLRVGNRDVEHVIADRLCAAADPEIAESQRPTTWVLFFDNPRLTLGGRTRAIQMAREALPQILGPGDRAAIVSNEDHLYTLQRWTSDPDRLRAGLDLMNEKDPLRPDPLGRSGPRRLYHGSPTFLRADLSRLAVVLGSFADVPPPKALIYFADVFVLPAADHTTLSSSARASLLDNGVLTFDSVVRQAAALGIRFYPVEPKPLMGDSETQRSLRMMAAETGGRAFVNGVTTERIVSGVREDRSCMWLLSFDAAQFPRDTFLPVSVSVDVPGVTVHARTQALVQSTSERIKNRLLARFALDLDSTPAALQAGVVPLGWKDGKYRARIQVVAPATPLPSSTWDLGASMVIRDKVVAETSARATVADAEVPLALEEEVDVRPGAYELVAVARETTTDQIVSSRHQGTWPDPDTARATVVQPTVLQKTEAAFTGDGQVGMVGRIVHGEDDWLDPTRSTNLVALVCRGKKVQSAFVVERAVVGAHSVPFPALTLDLGDERCGQISDVIPAHVLTAGQYRHHIVVRENGVEIARAETPFVVE